MLSQYFKITPHSHWGSKKNGRVKSKYSVGTEKTNFHWVGEDNQLGRVPMGLLQRGVCLAMLKRIVLVTKTVVELRILGAILK